MMKISFNFQTGQIVALEHGDKNLYAEVIQVVDTRQLCWVRPLLLVTYTQADPLIADLRDASDLLWPINLFQPALDTEVIVFLSEVLAKEAKIEKDLVAQQLLHQFIQQSWQAEQFKIQN